MYKKGTQKVEYKVRDLVVKMGYPMSKIVSTGPAQPFLQFSSYTLALNFLIARRRFSGFGTYIRDPSRWLLYHWRVISNGTMAGISRSFVGG